MADTVQRAFHQYCEDRLSKGADWAGWMQKEADVRDRLARLFNVKTTELALTGCASAGLNALASALSFDGDRDTVVVSDFDFPTSGQIWHAQKQRGARIVHVRETASGEISLEAFERAIDQRTKLVTISHVCYRHGGKLAIEEIIKLAHSRDALVLLDCYQSAGTEAIDLGDLNVDFAVGGMTKYLLGSAGLGYFYVRQDLTNRLVPTATGWLAQRDIHAMDLSSYQPAYDARRFQSGTPPVPNLYAALAGLDIVLEIGAAEIGKRVRQLTSECMTGLIASGFDVVTPREDELRGPMVAVRLTNDDQIVQRLAERDVIVSSRDGNVRAGFHFYNNSADSAAFVAKLREVTG